MSAAQCAGTMPGEDIATGVACGSTNSLRGGAVERSGKGWWLHVLNPELLNLLRMYSFKMGRFSSVGGHGSMGVSVGGGDLGGHLQGKSLGPTSPVFVHCFMACVGDSVRTLLHCPTCGKLEGTQPRDMQASSERYIPGTDFYT